MHKTPVTILRWELAFVFFYAAIASLIDKTDWIGYLPSFVTAIISPGIVLSLFSLYEIILAGLLFAGKKLKTASLLAAITLSAITLFNLGQLEITFRDIGLAMSALALYELVREKHLQKTA